MNGSSSGFKIQSEDFPALPGTTGQAPLNVAAGNKLDKDGSMQAADGNPAQKDEQKASIPPAIGEGSFGMAGISSFLKSMEKRDDKFQLAIGRDLTKFGLDLSVKEKNLHKSFGGPFTDSPARTQDIQCDVPDEYRISLRTKKKLPPITLNRLSEDTLFYFFYNCVGEGYQFCAGHELYNRDWRYHKGLSTWLTRFGRDTVTEQTATFEKGLFNVFDPIEWKKVTKEITLEYKDLEQAYKKKPTPDQEESFSSNLPPNFDFAANGPPNFVPNGPLNFAPNGPLAFPPGFPPGFDPNFVPSFHPSYPPNFIPNFGAGLNFYVPTWNSATFQQFK